MLKEKFVSSLQVEDKLVIVDANFYIIDLTKFHLQEIKHR